MCPVGGEGDRAPAGMDGHDHGDFDFVACQVVEYWQVPVVAVRGEQDRPAAVLDQ